MIAQRVDSLPEVMFDVRSQRWRYRDSRKFAPIQAITHQAERYIKQQKLELESLGRRYSEGKISLSAFQKDAATLVKEIHLGNAIAALGKQSDLSPDVFLEVGRQLKKQYHTGKDYQTGKPYGLKYLAQDLKAGSLSPSQLSYRLSMYGNSGSKSYWGVKTLLAVKDGYIEAMRVLGVAEHCPECVAMSGLWQPIRDITPIGEQCSCRSNCKCSIKYR